jgi:hypothetical protein
MHPIIRLDLRSNVEAGTAARKEDRECLKGLIAKIARKSVVRKERTE